VEKSICFAVTWTVAEAFVTADNESMMSAAHEIV
jgi:hypothetical protein